jgi:large subunit ribosomal protein L31e
MVEEKIVTINLRKKIIEKARWKRSKTALRILREILKKQTKSEKIKIDKKLNEKIWSRSSERPLAKLRIKVTKLDDGSVKVELVD